MFRTTLAAAISVAVLVLSASAARFTMVFDGLEFTLNERQAQLPPKPDKAGKKASKAYRSALKQLGKDSTALKTELKIAKKVVKLEKLADDELNGLIDAAIAELATEVQTRIDGLQSRLNTGAGAKASPAKVQNALEQAQDILGIALGEEKRKNTVRRLAQADARASKAEKLLDKLNFNGGGGGGGSECGGTPLTAGEMAGGTFGAGIQWTGEEVIIDGSGAQLTVTIIDCDRSTPLKYVFALPSPLRTGEFDALFNNVSLTVSTLDGSGSPSRTGTISIARADTRLEFTYSLGASQQGSIAIDLPR